MATITEGQVKAMAAALRDFGYAGLSDAQVREQAEKALAGEKPGNVIGMFVRGWLRDADILDDGGEDR